MIWRGPWITDERMGSAYVDAIPERIVRRSRGNDGHEMSPTTTGFSPCPHRGLPGLQEPWKCRWDREHIIVLCTVWTFRMA